MMVLMVLTMGLAMMSVTPVAEKLARLDWVRTTVPANIFYHSLITISIKATTKKQNKT